MAGGGLLFWELTLKIIRRMAYFWLRKVGQNGSVKIEIIQTPQTQKNTLEKGQILALIQGFRSKARRQKNQVLRRKG
jgi:hypothetical protein